MKITGLIILCSFSVFFFSCKQEKKPDESIHGTWITNVASDALMSKENIKKTIANCKKNGLNNIYVVVWHNGKTMYPSKVVEKYTGVLQDSVYQGLDPIKEIVEEGHKAGLKVHAWFEFGFSYVYNDSNSVWLKKYPDWAGRNNEGALLQKNNFFWWSGINPEVQAFMKELVTEVVSNYDVDGIQGDDRLPAMPVEGGYDDYTSKLYADQHNGEAPPKNFRDSAWLQWRADQLSNFGESLFRSVKKIRADCIVSWAPGIFPWSKEEYLEDWPKWLANGYADYVIPQLYRYKAEDYEKIVKELNTQIPDHLKQKIIPGILTSLGNGYQASPSLIDSITGLNSKYGFKGEVFFYYESLNRLPAGLFNYRAE
jgi:uncharacterized lipoprotein YddW (UPF0748 family)